MFVGYPRPSIASARQSRHVVPSSASGRWAVARVVMAVDVGDVSQAGTGAALREVDDVLRWQCNASTATTIRSCAGRVSQRVKTCWQLAEQARTRPAGRDTKVVVPGGVGRRRRPRRPVAVDH